MKRKHLLLTLLLALAVPLAALAQVERTVTVNNGTDKYHRVPAYGGREINQWYRNEFVIDKAYLQEMAGKRIIKMELYVAQPVPSSYMATSGSYAVRIREKDWATSGSYSGDSPAFRINPLTTLEDQQRNGSFDFDGKGNIVVRFSSSFLYSGEGNLVVQFESEKHNWLVSPFGIDNLPLYYGVNHTGYALEYCNTEQENTFLNGGVVFAKNQVRNFAPKVTFTYLDEATWANTNKPQNPVATALSSSSIRLAWEAGDYTGSNYQVLCVERGTTPNWSNAVTVSNTYYTFENLASNTTYDLYVRARTTVIVTYNSKAASATATTQHGGNLDEGPIAFDFSEGTHPNGLTVTGNDTHLVTYGGCLSYSGENTVTITLPRLHFTNATNGLMLEFNMNQPQGSQNPVQVELVDEYQNETLFSQNLTSNSYQSFSFRLKDGLAVSSVMLHNCYKIRFTATGPFSLYNINVRKLANVIPASSLAATDIATTSAKITWTDDNLNAHTLRLYHRTKGSSTWSGPITVTGTSHTLTSLTPYTQYEAMVKTISGTNEENSATLTFGTHCPEQQVPYEQDFTGLDALPQYWRIEGETSSTTYRYYVDDEGITFTSAISGNWVSERNAYIILPYFGNLASLQFSFENRGGGGYVTVGVMTDPFDVSSFRSREYVGNSIGTHNVNFGDNWASDIQYGHIALQVNKGYYDGYVQVDNFVVTRLAAPTGLVVSNVTNTTATLGWNAGAATEWEVRYGTDANNYGTPVAVTEPTYTITGLTANTEYMAQVRAKYGDGLYSAWEDSDFGTFKTLMQEVVVMNAENASYYEDFESGIGNWMFIDGGSGNRWKRSSYSSQFNGDQGYGLRITNSEATGMIINYKWQYSKRKSYTINNQTNYLPTPATSYAVKTFTLTAGHYAFDYRYAVKGIANEDYMRVVLVPAETAIEAGVMDDGFSYNTTPDGWFALDGGQQLTGYSANYYHWKDKTTVTLDVYPGGTYEPGNYMIVVLWNNEGSVRVDGENPPGAIDNVSVTWSSLVYPPAVAALHSQVTDTEAPVAMYAPEQGIAPTSYEVQYEPAAAVNTYEGAPIATFNVTENPQTVTLTGLTPLTLYSARVRSVYTANGHSVYSDWQDCPNLFTTLCPPPTHLAVVGQTTSWAHVMWTPVEMTLPSSQSIHYEYQLTTDQNNWDVPIISTDFGNNSCSQNFAPGTYYIRVRTYVEEYTGSALLRMGESDWSEPITFTIAPWTDPVTLFPLTYGFETPTYFDDGLTLCGALDRLKIYDYSNSQDQLPAHAGGESQSLLTFTSGSNGEACLVLPAIAPSSGTMNALVSFWWYHDNTEANPNDVGVTIEYSTDGTNWTAEAGGIIKRQAAETGWVKYQRKVFVYTKTYIRLRFTGADSDQWWKRCYLDDLKVDIFKSHTPYIAEVACEGNTANITLYDYAIEHDLYSTEMEVQYREYREPGQPEEEWTTSAFVLEAPYTFENTLAVNGLYPNTTYEFRARARASMPMPDGYGNYTAPWSAYCEPYIATTGCGTYTITPSRSYTEDFEELFNGTDCWTVGEGWTLQQAGGYNSSSYCAYSNGSTEVLLSPEISFSSECENAILRFYKKTSGGASSVYVYYGENFAQRTMLQSYAVSSWAISEYSLSRFMNSGSIKIGIAAGNANYGSYIDNIEIIANAYGKIFDGASAVQWSNANNWYPQGVPSANDDVMVMGTVFVGYTDGSNPYTASAKNIGFGSSGYVYVRPGSVLEATKINHKTASSVDVADGGQLKVAQSSVATMKKRFVGYNDVSDDDHFYLFAPPVVWPTTNPSSFTTGEYDLYRFDGENGGAEWRNYKQNNFVMQRGKGYLYAHEKPTTGTSDYTSVTMGGYVLPLGEETITGLVYGTNTDEQPFLNWNLVGNPFPCNAYLSGNRQFYRLVETAEGSRIVLATDNAIKPMEGVFVQAATEAESSVTFTTTEPTRSNNMAFAVHKAEQTRGGVSTGSTALTLDRVRIAIGEGTNLGHLDLMADANRLYIPLNGKDMAVVCSEPAGEMPLNFEVSENGTYTLSFENATEGLMYCHLIDNLTGADVDLLATSTDSVAEYTFEAKTTDYASRFKVVFASVCEDANGDSETFAFNSNGNWIILNEGRATLQVVDLTGRVLRSETINGSVQTQINQPSGLYLIRLLNGDDVKVQKVVVR